VIQVAKKLIEAVHRRQKLVASPKWFLAELAGAVKPRRLESSSAMVGSSALVAGLGRRHDPNLAEAGADHGSGRR